MRSLFNCVSPGIQHSGFGSPDRYTVTGTVLINEIGQDASYPDDFSEYDISGALSIDDAVEVHQESNGTIVFRYNILSFNFSIGPYYFSGSGYIRSQYYVYDYQENFTCTFDSFSIDGIGTWSFWRYVSITPDFYYKNGIAYDKGPEPSDFYNLPYKIVAEDFTPSNDGGFKMRIQDITIARSDPAAPVPEPSTVVLLCISFVTLAVRWKLSKI